MSSTPFLSTSSATLHLDGSGLFRQSARDPVVYAIVAAMVSGVAIVASTVPAWRAARIDPNRVLRAE